jgi:hypothetical protein
MALMTGPSALAQSLTPFQIGSHDTVTAEPPIARPHTQPVAVPLFQNVAFTDYTPKMFSYTPPPGAPRRWARIVLTVDFSVTAGRQFDRSTQIALGGANIFFGTTQEPSLKVAPTWHAERDLTDYGALLAAPQSGLIELGNVVDATYTGVIHGSATLLFYPANAQTPVPETPDIVLPLPTPTGAAATLTTGTDSLSGTFTFPTNVERAYLDIITQSQGKDEFWYTNVPDELKAKLQQNGGTAFREAEITIDDRPAGVAPVFPWIYTGGIDPALWRPLPGIQTLNFVPFRVDLTPFSGVLSDGKPHQISLRVFNASDNFRATGTLLLYRDPQTRQVRGGVTEDTLDAAPTPTIHSDVTFDKDNNANGTLSVTSDRHFTIRGYVQTARGRIETQIVQDLTFANVQQYVSAGTKSIQNVHQDTLLASATTVRDGDHIWEHSQHFDYPLVLDTTAFAAPDKSGAQTLTIRQGYHRNDRWWQDSRLLFSNALSEEASPSDITTFDAKGNPKARTGPRSVQTYFYDDSLGGHDSLSLTAKDGALTAIDPRP